MLSPMARIDVVVPARLVDAADGLGPGIDEDLVPPRLVVEGAPVALADIGLVARHLAARDADAAELDAAVPLAVGQLGS